MKAEIRIRKIKDGKKTLKDGYEYIMDRNFGSNRLRKNFYQCNTCPV